MMNRDSKVQTEKHTINNPSSDKDLNIDSDCCSNKSTRKHSGKRNSLRE